MAIRVDEGSTGPVSRLCLPGFFKTWTLDVLPSFWHESLSVQENSSDLNNLLDFGHPTSVPEALTICYSLTSGQSSTWRVGDS